MKTQKVIEKKTLEKLVQQKLIVKIDEFQYRYRSTNGYIEIIFAPGDLLLPPERQSLDSHKVEHTIASLVNQAHDMLDCYNFYQILSDFVENQWMSDELKQKYLKAMNLYDPSKQKHQGNKNLNQPK